MNVASSPTNTLPMPDLLHSTVDECRNNIKIIVGLAVFVLTPTGPSLLLLKRAPTEITLPNVWELPSGKVDPGETVHEAMKRELHEETNLSIHRILAVLEPFAYVLPKTITDEQGLTAIVHKTSIQYNAAITVTDLDAIKLNPDEHSEYKWVRAQDLPDCLMTEGMETVVRNALAWGERNQRHIQENAMPWRTTENRYDYDFGRVLEDSTKNLH